MYVCMYVRMHVSMYVCMYGVIFLKYSTYLHFSCVRLIIRITEGLETLMPLSWDASLPMTHIICEKVCHHILTQIVHFAWRHEVCPFVIFLVETLISSDNRISM